MLIDSSQFSNKMPSNKASTMPSNHARVQPQQPSIKIQACQHLTMPTILMFKRPFWHSLSITIIYWWLIIKIGNKVKNTTVFLFPSFFLFGFSPFLFSFSFFKKKQYNSRNNWKHIFHPSQKIFNLWLKNIGHDGDFMLQEHNKVEVLSEITIPQQSPKPCLVTTVTIIVQSLNKARPKSLDSVFY